MRDFCLLSANERCPLYRGKIKRKNLLTNKKQRNVYALFRGVRSKACPLIRGVIAVTFAIVRLIFHSLFKLANLIHNNCMTVNDPHSLVLPWFLQAKFAKINSREISKSIIRKKLNRAKFTKCKLNPAEIFLWRSACVTLLKLIFAGINFRE